MKKLIHLSDLHFRKNWEEDQGLVLTEFFKDLGKQLSEFDLPDVYIVFSGDVVLAGGNVELYDDFLNQFNIELDKLKILKIQRICIPGNHDVSVDLVKENFVEHEGVIKLNLNEKDFNDFIQKDPIIISNKFTNYKKFELDFSSYGIANSILSGYGFNLEENIGVFCLNTATLSSGGANAINDKGRLAINTRSLHKWLQENKAKTKVLVMHHPMDWLVDWAQIELKKIIRNSFSLCLSGHVHEQDIYHSINNDDHLVECSAPPLLTNKRGRLGYSIISVSDKGVENIIYRQWTKNNTFVTGVDFSNTDNGKIVVVRTQEKGESSNDITTHLVTSRLETALRTFSSQPIVWVNPIVSKTNIFDKRGVQKISDLVDISDFINNPISSFIKAPPQFGLTCLSFYLIQQAWIISRKNWLYLDFTTLKSHTIERNIKKELEFFAINLNQVKCIILDSWVKDEKDSNKILKMISDTYINIPIVVMHRIDDSKFELQPEKEKIDREFKVFHLLALSRNDVRKVVSDYNMIAGIGSEETLLAKMLRDINVLNIPRTPLNCITLLKVAEKYFDESPVNRTRMLEMVLFVLFDTEYIPMYKTKPDLKDCEYVLGRYCEKLIKSMTIQFSREDFLVELKQFCNEKLIDLDIDILFDIFYKNNIIIKQDNGYRFKFTYWIYYFVAQRMHHDRDFANYMLTDKKYVSYPEVIEFYTGIDRRRDDALIILLKDLNEIFEIVKDKVGLSEDMKPFAMMTWNPTTESLEKMQNEITKNVLNSNLPDLVKDQYADKEYDAIRPYNQNIRAFFENYSINSFSYAIRATSRALRNSDYVDPAIKKELLQIILKSWEEFTKILVAIIPVLSEHNQVFYDDAQFVLEDDFGTTPQEKAKGILKVVPYNVVKWFKDDLASEKIGPLLFDQLKKENNEIRKHELAILIIRERPKMWKNNIQDYIGFVSKNSFFLLDIIESLSAEYKYSYADAATLKDIEFLIKMGFAKHEFGDKKPGLDKIKRISNNTIPKREADE